MATKPLSRSGHVLLGTVLAVLLGALAWQKAIKPNVIPKNFGVVVPGQIYRSGELTPSTLRKVVEENQIRTILDLGTFTEGSAGDRREQATAHALGVVRYRFSLNGDATGNPNFYVQALQLMNDPAKRPILVHCGAGSERTGCVVILYRNIIEGKAIDDVYTEALEYRHRPERNPRLRQVLDEWGSKIQRAFESGTQIPGIDPAPDLKPVPATPAN
jgi:protein tyrosine/serine phosphatase